MKTPSRNLKATGSNELTRSWANIINFWPCGSPAAPVPFFPSVPAGIKSDHLETRSQLFTFFTPAGGKGATARRQGKGCSKFEDWLPSNKFVLDGWKPAACLLTNVAGASAVHRGRSILKITFEQPAPRGHRAYGQRVKADQLMNIVFQKRSEKTVNGPGLLIF